jgi:hypothetical protein
MPKSLRVIAALLFVTAQLLVPAAMAGEAAPSGPMPQIAAFEHEDFLGDHTHLFGDMKDLGKWGNSISSMVILSGTWEFFADEDRTGTRTGTLGPGTSADVTKHGLRHNSISSVRLVKPAASATR